MLEKAMKSLNMFREMKLREIEFVALLAISMNNTSKLRY
jgi:hypothetical protein